jgi:hypothetical protein
MKTHNGNMNQRPSPRSNVTRAIAFQAKIGAIDEKIVEIQGRGFEDATGLQLQPTDRQALKEWESQRALAVEKLARIPLP